MRRDLLLALADHLEKNVPETHFDLGPWRMNNPDVVVCGTAGCAIGHAPNVPEIKAMEFKCNSVPEINLGHKKEYSWDAVTYLFGIDMQTAYALFSEGAYEFHQRDATPKDVAKRIRRYAETGKISR